ncbi:hypothetical protein CVS40_3297 [Lucilia cuprina]|nr:hypothetical protein CVS40_3297 [Lucilia cuprina]
MEFNGKCWNAKENWPPLARLPKGQIRFLLWFGEKQVYKPELHKVANKKQAFSKNLKLPFHTEGK